MIKFRDKGKHNLTICNHLKAILTLYIHYISIFQTIAIIHKAEIWINRGCWVTLPLEMRSIFIIILSIIAYAESVDASQPLSAVDSLPPKVSLITVGPGQNVYELEGHTMLRFRYAKADGTYAPDVDPTPFNYATDRHKREDMMVNWGVFDFNAPFFIYRFVKGETDYIAAEGFTKIVLSGYADDGREVKELQLNLSAAQAFRLDSLVRENLLPENRVYRYNYVKDNCATRPLALIEKSMEADSAMLLFPDETAADDSVTFRNEMRRYHRDFPTYQFGIDLALGSGIDHPITRRERCFAPVYLHEYIKEVGIRSADGSITPLAADETVLLTDAIGGAKENGVPPWVIVYGFALAALLFALRDWRKRSASRWLYSAVFGIYGMAGCVIAFLVFISSHEATAPNVNLMWLNPLALIPATLIWFKSAKNIVFCYQIVNFVLDLAFICGAAFFSQSINPLFVPLAAVPMLLSVNYIALKTNKR